LYWKPKSTTDCSSREEEEAEEEAEEEEEGSTAKFDSFSYAKEYESLYTFHTGNDYGLQRKVTTSTVKPLLSDARSSDSRINRPNFNRSAAIGFYRLESVKRDPRGTSDRPANDSDSE
jgi:hypothetical protein